MQAWQIDDSNVYATIGMANILVESGMIEEGLEIYNTVKDEIPQSCTPMFNIAHINMIQGNFDNALNIYKKALSKFYRNHNYDIECWIANTYFIKKDLEQSIKSFKLLICKYPNDIFIRYNLGIVLQSFCTEGLNIRDKKLKEVERIVSYLKITHSIFKMVLAWDHSKYRASNESSESQVNYKSRLKGCKKECDARLIFIENYISDSHHYIEQAIAYEKDIKFKREEQERIYREMIEKDQKAAQEIRERELELYRIKQEQVQLQDEETRRKFLELDRIDYEKSVSKKVKPKPKPEPRDALLENQIVQEDIEKVFDSGEDEEQYNPKVWISAEKTKNTKKKGK